MGGEAEAFGDALWRSIMSFSAWLGVQPTGQDLVKAILLAAFVLIILMILGDVYRGEIQNTFHRVRLIPNPAKDDAYRQALQLPRYVVDPTLDGTYSNALFHYRYRDYRGRLRTKFLHAYRVRLRVRTAFPERSAPGQENVHHYSDDEKLLLAKEKPDLETGNRPISEIVAMAASRVDYIKEEMDRRMAREHQLWSQLETSRLWRIFFGVRSSELQEPQPVGLVVKFHFPINPYFLLYRHPDTNIRSTAWLTVLTSVFALFMQLVYTPRLDSPDAPARAPRVQARTASMPATDVSLTSAHFDEESSTKQSLPTTNGRSEAPQ